MNGILILAEDIISEAGGGLAWELRLDTMLVSSGLLAVCWSTEWWDYSYLITDIHQVTRADQLPPAPL